MWCVQLYSKNIITTTTNVFGAIRKPFILALPNNIREPEESPYIFWLRQ